MTTKAKVKVDIEHLDNDDRTMKISFELLEEIKREAAKQKSERIAKEAMKSLNIGEEVDNVVELFKPDHELDNLIDDMEIIEDDD